MVLHIPSHAHKMVECQMFSQYQLIYSVPLKESSLKMVLDHGQISKTCKYQPLSISKMDGSLETQKLTVLHPSTQNMIRQEFKNVLIIVDVDSMNAAHTGQMPTTRDVSLKLLEELRKQLPHCNHGLHNALQLKAVHQFQPLMTLQMKLKHKQLNFLKQKV
jgi:hypothetical protein